ncbi:MAG: methyl-accepting chemotaxis protein [Granulosicoccus sp.]
MAIVLCALSVSIFGIVTSNTVAQQRALDMHTAWQTLQSDSLSGSDAASATNVLSANIIEVPILQSANLWAAALAALSFLLLGWMAIAARKLFTQKTELQLGIHRSEDSALSRLDSETSPLLNGDLRSSATENSASTGAVAKTFNHAVGELRWLVGTLNSSAVQLAESLAKSRESADKVSSACSEQSRRIHLSSNDLFSMSATMSGLSADAAESSYAAKTAVEKAEAGGVALSASLHRLSAIRDEADSTTRVMHRLAENVSAIDECVTVIQDVAKQTDLLALNTTIRASAGSRAATVNDAAADLGRLSDEVAQLAEVLGQATRDISAITRTITQDASGTVQSMEHIASELASGVEQTQQASDALDVIQVSSHTLHESVVQMTERCVEQTGFARKITQSMDEINQISDQTIDGLALNAVSLDELQKLTVEMQNALVGYQMPEVHRRTGSKNSTLSVARRAADRAVNA